MLSAMYYPHTQIRDEDFLKASLLTWDEVGFISPYPNFALERSRSVTVNTALDLLCKPHAPTAEEKRRVHARVLALLGDGVPAWLTSSTVPASLRAARPVREYRDANDMGIYPRKLDPKTWELLQAAGLVTLNADESKHYSAPLVGFLLMSLLADACAGETRQKITDRVDAYSFLWKVAAAEAHVDFLPSASAPVDSLHARLVTLSVRAINTDDIPLENLVAMRQREARSSSAHAYRAMRRRYSSAIQVCAKRLVTEGKSKADRVEIERQFQLELQDDIAALRAELGVAKTALVFSKEVGVTLLATAGMFIEPISASTIAWGALVADVLKFSDSYKKALSGHPTSWLYLSARPWRDLLRDIIG